MDTTQQEAQAEEQFKQKLKSFFASHPGVDKPAKKFLFMTISKPSKQFTIDQKGELRNITITASLDSNGEVSEGSVKYTKGDKTIELSAGLVDPPAIVVEVSTDPDGEGVVVSGIDDPYFKDIETILN